MDSQKTLRLASRQIAWPGGKQNDVQKAAFSEGYPEGCSLKTKILFKVNAFIVEIHPRPTLCGLGSHVSYAK